MITVYKGNKKFNFKLVYIDYKFFTKENYSNINAVSGEASCLITLYIPTQN